MGYRVGVVGASGYAGGELLRILAGHGEFDAQVLAAGSRSGVPVTDVHPGLGDRAGEVFTETDPDALVDLDLVFLALPHGHSAALAQAIPDTVRVVDLGADHRLRSPRDWAEYYGTGTSAPPWPYGLPETPGAREALTAADRVAGPGCYATAITLSAWPLVAAGLVAAELVTVAASGTSGAGRTPTEALLATEVMGSMTAYKVGGVHQHTPEIEQAIGDAAGTRVTLSFTPLLAPMPRGILATTTAAVRDGVTETDLRDALSDAYSGEPFVRMLPPGRWPTTAATAGANTALIQVALDEHARRAVVVTAIDNLQKGAAGQAVQCANLMVGLPETMGLSTLGVTP
ncbi:MAG: N-acetyl-gamma-glutamyl-phosphate reductase [Candidatus Nanopelagicales bacterium]